MSAGEKGNPSHDGNHPDNSAREAGCSPNPISRLMADHELQFKLCDVLEAIADGLPDEVDPSLLLFAIPYLRNEFRQHMKFEDDVLFPLLRQRVSKSSDLNSILDQLAHEHEVDENYGTELADHLDELVLKGSVGNPNMVGYMLRGFFESQRRHIEWENTVVLPLAREVLTPQDLDRLDGLLPAQSVGEITGDDDSSAPGHSKPAACSGGCDDCKKVN